MQEVKTGAGGTARCPELFGRKAGRVRVDVGLGLQQRVRGRLQNGSNAGDRAAQPRFRGAHMPGLYGACVQTLRRWPCRAQGRHVFQASPSGYDARQPLLSGESPSVALVSSKTRSREASCQAGAAIR